MGTARVRWSDQSAVQAQGHGYWCASCSAPSSRPCTVMARSNCRRPTDFALPMVQCWSSARRVSGQQLFFGVLCRTFVRFKVLLLPADLCEAGMNPVSVMTMLNCLGYMCFDSMRQPTTDKTRKYNKHANPGEHACSCGGTPFGRGAPDRSSFESWANSVIGTCKWVAFVYVIYRIVVSSGCGPPAEN